jgi:hypothetical protein
MSRRIGLALVLVLLCAAHSAARRAPGPGGTVVVSVPASLLPAVIDAHVFAPLLVPRESAAPDAAVVPGAGDHTSTVLASMTHEASGKRWRIVPVAPAADVATALQRCLGGRDEHSFAGSALRAAGVTAVVTPHAHDVVVSFSGPVFVLPQLIAWCPLRPASAAPTGPYSLTGPGRLAWRAGSYEAPPLLGAIELRPPLTSGNDRADAVVAPGNTDMHSGGGATLLSPWPDVIALVQSDRTRDDDPFGLSDSDAGTLAFRNALRADLLAAAWSNGRGGPTQALLPPGVAPARPLPVAGGVSAAPLALTPVPKDAPRLPLLVREGDPLSDAVAERLAVLLRGRRWLLETRRTASVVEGAEVVRWRPPSRDAALSLLSFVGEREGLLGDDAVKKALADTRLLGDNDAQRLAAALALERALLDSHLVVPLIVVERALLVDPDLRGVVVRGDGVPLFDGAWWGGGR